MLDVVKIASGVFDSEMETFETAMPGNVAKVNEGGTVDVRPSIRNCLSNMQLEPTQKDGQLRTINNVPVLFPGTASAIVKFELQEGDPVLLVASSRDLSEWKAGDWFHGLPCTPRSFAGNDLNSLLAIPVRMESHGDKKPKITFTVKKDGKVEIETASDIAIKAGTLDIEGDLKVSGNIEAMGDMESGGCISAGGEVTVNAKNRPLAISTHVHATAQTIGTPSGPESPSPTPSI